MSHKRLGQGWDTWDKCFGTRAAYGTVSVVEKRFSVSRRVHFRTYLKLFVPIAGAIFALAGCYSSGPKRFVIADDKSYASSLFRQNCAVCHGPEADGRTLDDGTKVPSLREADFKFKTRAEILNQLANGGNGMTPFRDQLTERERNLLADFVLNDLRRGNQPSNTNK